jgi:hypothetical protein
VGLVTIHIPSPLERALTEKLTALVATRRLTEAQAAEILDGYEYPELALWIHEPLDQIQVPDLDSVLVLGEQFRTEQARQRVAEAQLAEAPLGYIRTRSEAANLDDADDLGDG